jgi:hypothetical protein
VFLGWQHWWVVELRVAVLSSAILICVLVPVNKRKYVFGPRDKQWNGFGRSRFVTCLVKNMLWQYHLFRKVLVNIASGCMRAVCPCPSKSEGQVILHGCKWIGYGWILLILYLFLYFLSDSDSDSNTDILGYIYTNADCWCVSNTERTGCGYYRIRIFLRISSKGNI